MYNTLDNGVIKNERKPKRIISIRKTNKKLEKYLKHEYDLEIQGLTRGFGHMILSKHVTEPKYSFGKTKRFETFDEYDNYKFKKLGREFSFNKTHSQSTLSIKNPNFNSIYDFNKTIYEKDNKNANKNIYKPNNNSIKYKKYLEQSKTQTDFLYLPKPSNFYKYSNSPKFSFPKSKKEFGIGNKIKYNYYNNKYDPNDELEKLDKKWSKRVIGGFIGTESRNNQNNQEFEDKYKKPGPGRYNPNVTDFKYPKSPFCLIGNAQKPSFFQKTTTSNKIAPGTYNVELKFGEKRNNFKFSNSPKFAFGTEQRNLVDFDRQYFCNEGYLKYSSFGEQIETQKDSRPGYTLGKEKRFRKIFFK